jgi:hypothetical protein
LFSKSRKIPKRTAVTTNARLRKPRSPGQSQRSLLGPSYDSQVTKITRRSAAWSLLSTRCSTAGQLRPQLMKHVLVQPLLGWSINWQQAGPLCERHCEICAGPLIQIHRRATTSTSRGRRGAEDTTDKDRRGALLSQHRASFSAPRKLRWSSTALYTSCVNSYSRSRSRIMIA